MGRSTVVRSVTCAATLAMLAIMPARALAHCDGMDGPVVKAAQQALAAKNPALVLIWVQPNDAREVQRAFDQTLAVRELSAQAKDLADRFFFETVVRLHRAGEGAAFTGLRPAGADLGPAIPAADKAISNGSVEPVIQLLIGAVQERVGEQFGIVVAAKRYDANDVAAGRAYVKAYVEFIHLVERLYEATVTAPHGHFSDSTGSAKER